jgi:hypothetical protein
MPDRKQSTPPSAPPPPPTFPDFPPPPPRAVTSDWEQWEGFRFTFLRHFPRERDTKALRGLAQLLYDLILESPRPAEPLPGPETRWELVAALGELRFLQGYLLSVFEEHRVSSLPPEVESLSRLAGGISYDVGEIADRLSEELAKWRKKHGR